MLKMNKEIVSLIKEKKVSKRAGILAHQFLMIKIT